MLELNEKTFDGVINGDLPAVVDFWAEWCMPCKIFSPVLEELSDELDGKAEFCKVNIDECPDLARKYEIEVIPTIVFFKGGEPLGKITGVLPKEEVRKAAEKYIMQ